jgi:hypothetical protein
MAFYCKNCGHEIAIDPVGRIAPWCSHCGADVQREPAGTESGTEAADLGGADRHCPPANLSQGTRSVGEKLPRPEPMCFQLAWHEPAAFRRALEPIRPAVRWIRNFLLALFIPTSLGLAAIYGFGELFLPPLTLIISKTLGTGFLCLVGVPLIILASTRILSCYVTIGPDGISRIRSIPMGHHAMVHRWGFPWKDIQELLYLEDCPLGGRGWRVLVVQSVAGEKEIIGIANEVSRERLAAAVAGWGKGLEGVSEPGLPRRSEDLASVP